MPELESLQNGRQTLHHSLHLELKRCVEAAAVKCAFQFDAGLGQAERLLCAQSAGDRVQHLAEAMKRMEAFIKTL